MMANFQLSYFLIAALLECKAQTQRSCSQLHQLNINHVQRESMSISCLTTTHSFSNVSLTVKLRKNDPVTDILIYPDISPSSEEQRWSVRKDAGNVTLDLKDIRLSDGGLYDCQVYKDQDCLKATRFTLTVKDCKTLESIDPDSSSSVLLPCSEDPQQNTADQVTWKVIKGHQLTEIKQYRSPPKPSKITEKLLKPLYERVRQLKNGSLLIRDVVKADESWYQCRVDEKTCYEVKLLIKDVSTPVASTTDQTKGYNDTSAAVTTNLTAVVMSTVTSLFVLISLIISVIVYFKKRRSKINSQFDLNCQSTYYSEILRGFDVPAYSLAHQSTNHEHLWGEQTETSMCEPDHLYDNAKL